MTVMKGLPVSWRPDPGDMDTHSACRFLQTQASWLAHGLDRADDATTVGIVLGRHDSSHEAWCGLIGDVTRLDAQAASDLLALYGFHGRIVGSLERGMDARLCPDIHSQVRSLLRSRLVLLTSEAVDDLLALPLPSGSTSAAAPATA